jgi:hypothetical protein
MGSVNKQETLGVNATVFQAEIFIILPCPRDGIERNCAGEQVYTCSVVQLCELLRQQDDTEAGLGMLAGNLYPVQ